jgi:DNA uptake protein ComE-like DNA-binding protein
MSKRRERYSALNLVIALALGAQLLACGIEDDPIDGETDSLHDGLVISEADAFLILGLLNDAGTTLAFLDDEVGLNARAAANIVAYRSGGDGVVGSADDQQFDSLAELDSVSYVGPVAITLLRDYVAAHPPAAKEIVEGIEFSGEQAAAVVWGVNRASRNELDYEVGLEFHAAANLVALAPHASVTEMGPVPYVGPAALAKLRVYAPVWQAGMAAAAASSLAGTFDGVTFDEKTAEIALEIANEATLTQLTGEGGMWSSGAERIVAHRPYGTLAAVAGAYGVGPATMQDLKDYANSGAWRACSLSFPATSLAPVDAYAAGVFAYDPGADYAKWTLATVLAPTCVNGNDPTHIQTLRDLLIDLAGWGHVRAEFPEVLEPGPMVVGAGAFQARLDQSLAYMNDYRADYVAAGRPDAEAEYEALVAQHAALTALIAANPGTTISFGIHLEAVECSEEAALVVDTAAGIAIAIRRGPRC